MDSFLKLNKNTENLHHAYFFITQNPEVGIEALKEFLVKKLGMNFVSNPDFYHKKFENFGMEDARFIGSNENRKSLLGKGKVFIIEANFINHEAQNALLKIFEEPSSGTYFFIFSPQDVLLPTLKSRIQVYVLEDEIKGRTRNILDMTIAERLELVKEITDGIKDEEMTKQDAIRLLNTIEKKIYEMGVQKYETELGVCIKTREALYDRGAPIKMVLENLVLSI